tara:strand:- start:483 stop:848 length:366 start_codon:yes stop_codon:yes gene_type:complete
MTIKKNRTFSDLEFHTHAHQSNGVQARLDLGNNIEISVVSMKDKETEFGGLYGSVKAGTYELAVFHNNNMVPLSAYDDVLGWQTEDNINELMGNLQGDAEGFIAGLYVCRDESGDKLMATD